MSTVPANSNHEEIKADVVESSPQKALYVRPSLVVYGTVVQFTKGNISAGSEGNMKRNSGQDNNSDRAVKENITRVGEHPLGIGLYLFDYKPSFRDAWGHGRQFGVMADEVERVMPEAVRMNSDGYRTVDYAMLGIERAKH